MKNKLQKVYVVVRKIEDYRGYVIDSFIDIKVTKNEAKKLVKNLIKKDICADFGDLEILERELLQ